MAKCECSDPGCPACWGQCDQEAEKTLYRIDMEDETGTVFCDVCCQDAFDSGLFATRDLEEDSYCDCGEEWDTDCQGEKRCPMCDPPCPHGHDGGGPGWDEDGEDDNE